MAKDTSFVVFESNLGDMVRGMGRVELHDSLKGLSIKLSVSMPETLRERLRHNTLLNNDVQLKLAKAIQELLRERIFPGLNGNSRGDAILRNRVDHVVGAATPDLIRIVQDTIRTHMKNAAAWNEYRVDSSKEIARISLTLVAAGVAAAVAPPTSGLSGGLLALTLVRGLVDAARKFSEAYRTAEESRLRLLREIETLTGAYRAGKAPGRAKQLGGAALHALTIGKGVTIFRSDPMPGFTRIKTELNAYKGKLGHLAEHAEKLGWRLYQSLDAIDAHQVKHSRGGGGDGPELRQLEARISALLLGGVSGKRHGFRGTTTISDAWHRSQKGLEELSKVERQLNTLKALEDRESMVLIADRTVTLLLNLGVTLAGYNAAFTAADGSVGAVQMALRVDPGGAPGAANGGAALGLGFFRHFMSLFKDSHALAKELGIVTKTPEGSQALIDQVGGAFDDLLPPLQARPGAELVRALEERYAHRLASARPPRPSARFRRRHVPPGRLHRSRPLRDNRNRTGRA